MSTLGSILKKFEHTGFFGGPVQLMGHGDDLVHIVDPRLASEGRDLADAAHRALNDNGYESLYATGLPEDMRQFTDEYGITPFEARKAMGPGAAQTEHVPWTPYVDEAVRRITDATQESGGYQRFGFFGDEHDHVLAASSRPLSTGGWVDTSVKEYLREMEQMRRGGGMMDSTEHYLQKFGFRPFEPEHWAPGKRDYLAPDYSGLSYDQIGAGLTGTEAKLVYPLGWRGEYFTPDTLPPGYQNLEPHWRAY